MNDVIKELTEKAKELKERAERLERELAEMTKVLHSVEKNLKAGNVSYAMQDIAEALNE